MDSKSIGSMITKLRRQNEWTQAQLAEKIGVSDKAVSKWENGNGYPDITMLPILADIFAVSIDCLIMGEERGITIAGTTLVDIVKNIDRYPDMGMLANILDVQYAVGGCTPNTAINLAKIDRRIPISAIGKVGMDENGRYVVSTLQNYGVNVSKMCYTTNSPTSSSEVMSVPSGERTFFHQKGANAEFAPEDIDIDALNCNIFHIGYVLLLDKFDEKDKQYGTHMARLLNSVQKKGIKTSIDLVSNSEGEYGEKVIPVLKYCNYVIINEIECCGIWNIDPRNEDGSINIDNVRLAMEKCIDAGVEDKVIVHCKEACFMLDFKKRFTKMGSLRISPEEIKGTVGAGDAFCAGCLYGIYNKYSDTKILEFASAAAACNLTEANAIDGMKPRNEILMLAERKGRLPV